MSHQHTITLPVTELTQAVERGRVKLAITLEDDVRLAQDVVETPTEQYFGTAEVAELLGVSKQRVSQLRQTAHFPQPAFVLKATSVWRKRDIEAFVTRHRRRQSR